MSIDFGRISSQTDLVLKGLGLYENITYVDTQDSLASYDPVKGTYGGVKPITYTFQAVVVTEENVLQSDGTSYGLGQQLIVVPSQIKFDLSVGQILSFNGDDWIISSFNRAPQNTIITISIRRK